ncbi:MAG: YARHG domain-containing protein [Lachnospiraceae bacterium]|nr:YARHG domain-containing protein [Lachnospiraceae bacterium]
MKNQVQKILLITGIALAVCGLAGCKKDEKSLENAQVQEKAEEKSPAETAATTETTKTAETTETESEIPKEAPQNWNLTLEEFMQTLPKCEIDGAQYAFDLEEEMSVYVSEGLKGVSGCMCTAAHDLDSDGMEEIIAYWLKENPENGNNISMQIYDNRGNGFELADEVTVLEGVIGTLCDSGNIRFLLKDKKYICIDSALWTYLAADGVQLDMRLYEYDGQKIKEIMAESLLGSDFYESGRHHGETLGKLREMGMEKTALNIEVRDNYSFNIGDVGMEMTAGLQIENNYSYEAETVEPPVATCRLIAGKSLEEEFILPQSAEVYLTEQEISGLDKEQLRIARNEIYARYGRVFEAEDLKAYFNEKSWYMTGGSLSVDDSLLTEIEKANVQLILEREAGL